MTSERQTVTSADGTLIALGELGDGPPVVLVGGAFNDLSTVAGLAKALAPHLTAITYDRRGRGGSGDNSRDFDPARELDDLAAVLDHAGGSASVFGHFSGATLALTAAQQGLAIDRLATITVPTLVIHGGDSPPWMAAAAAAVAQAIPGARHLTLTGQDHAVLQQPDALRPALVEFLTGRP
ncbi:MAG TPA: hypothetical protein VHM23_02880 [Actinomycetota bacterium]|jgi:pimeloyl-ACP methyl ester carboxylesterase|nr:hypothetical protein [Actinomycetota bacterium]